LEAALTEKQETEAKLSQAQQRINQLEDALRYILNIMNNNKDRIITAY